MTTTHAPAVDAALIAAAGLTQTFGTHTVLDRIDLTIGRGEFVTIMGPSGSGKSTLLYALSGLSTPTSGTVRLGDAELTGLGQAELSALRLAHVGFVFQQINLLKNLTLLDNVVLPAFMLPSTGRADRAAAVARGRELMEQMGVGELAERDVTQASGGQLQRVGLCRALINDPDVLFGDEPTGALDSAAAAQILDLLAGVHAAGTTVVLVTHDARVAARSERVIVLRDGVVAADRHLGPVAPGTLDARHADLTEWLLGLGL